MNFFAHYYFHHKPNNSWHNAGLLFPDLLRIFTKEQRISEKSNIDFGYNQKDYKNLIHGIIVSEKDLSSGIRWFNGIMTLNIIGARGSAIGTGKSNTALIIKNNGEKRKNYAAGVATLYDGGGYNDWVLPSFEELNKLYTNKTFLGMSEGWYWSSTESDNYSIWFLDFKFGFKELARHNQYRVRATRYF